MKKFLALFLTAALLLAMLGACSADNPGNTNPPDPTAGASATVPPTDNTQEPSVGLPSAEPTDEPTDQPTDEPTDQPTDEPTGEPTQTPESDPPVTNPPATNPPATNPPATNPPATNPPATDPPVTDPPATDPPASDPPASDPPASDPPGVPGIPGFGGVVIPGLGGPTGPTGPTGPSQPGGDTETPVEPTGPSASDINLEEFFWTIADKYDFPGMDVLPTEFIIQLFPGLASIPAVQRVVAIKGTTPTDMEVVLIQVSNSSDLSKVEEIFGNRIQYLLTTQGNYPSVVKNWTNYVQIVNRGNYIMLVVHENYDAIVSDFIALF